MKRLPAIDSGAGATNCRHAIRLLQTGEAYVCSSAETLLQGMARLGKKGIPVGCLNGGCGVCKVVIRCGTVRKAGAMSRAHISEEEEGQGIVLACRVMPVSAIDLDVIGKMKKAVTRTLWGGNAV
ncbi:2Fe-2S iron-sulfur cluster-binding protein [Noviherbaspirillum sp. Root189]|uniref:2Fe-2S iron-sulfur cluster-binding protein n=1 Tax=Noviherbaspirillum sp. Root189 TaxID=1736487 RepID=UPI000710C18B|nr:2Fe-2S iron-sulfur cluster-binding protein [Noviherbaspirillum sp. Root189]KRB81015.1 ferredoxin [Noviherbaspirillum sp. Root189]